MDNLIQQNTRVAIVDDDALYCDLIGTMIARQSKIASVAVASGEDLYKIVDKMAIDCILMDYHLANESGFAVSEHLRSHYRSAPPIVMLTADESQGAAIKALRLGISDYVLKRNLRPHALISAIERAVNKDRREKLVVSEHLRLAEAAQIDLLTGLYSRATLDGRILQLAALKPQIRENYALILVELKELPQIIARFGLKAGDQAILAMSQRLRVRTASSDIFGRFSTDSFLLIVNVRSSAFNLDRVCERLVEELSFRIDFDDMSLLLSANVGGVMVAPGLYGPIVTPLDLMAPALAALASARTTAQGLSTTTLATISYPADPAMPLGDGDTAGIVPEEAPYVSEPLREDNRRRAPRHKVLKRAVIIIPQLNGTIDCMVRNISVSGARLSLSAESLLPQRFQLLISGGAGRRLVQVRWQTGRDIGVEYMR